jgi:hypothetical protein
MTLNEKITLGISATSLIISLITAAFQFLIRDDLRYTVSEVWISSDMPPEGEKRTVVLSFNLTIFNLGNRSATLLSMSTFVAKANYDNMPKEDIKINPKNEDINIIRYMTPIEQFNRTRNSVKTIVIPKEDLISTEQAFDFFYYSKSSDIDILEVEG